MDRRNTCANRCLQLAEAAISAKKPTRPTSPKKFFIVFSESFRSPLEKALSTTPSTREPVYLDRFLILPFNFRIVR